MRNALDRLDFVLDFMTAADMLALALYQNPRLSVARKPDGSFVTPADTGIERAFRERVETHFPRDGILGEEEGDTPGSSAYRFVIDPIDGTRSFVEGVPTFATLIGVQERLPDGTSRIVAGVAHFPALGETIWAQAGRGARWRTSRGEEREARVQQDVPVERAAVQAPSVQSFRKAGKAGAFEALAPRVSRFHGWNDALSFALACSGRSAGVVGMNFSLWDVAPFIVIMQEAGGALTDWRGRSLLDGARTCVGGAPHLHGAMLECLAPHAGE